MSEQLLTRKNSMKVKLIKQNVKFGESKVEEEKLHWEAKTRKDVRNHEMCDFISYQTKVTYDAGGKSCGVIIDPKTNKVSVYPYLNMVFPVDNSSRIQMILKEKDEFGRGFDELPIRMADLFTEIVLDFWNKFKVTQFAVMFNPDTKEVMLVFNKSLNKIELNGYFMKHDTDGYNLKASFWKRNWLRPDQKLAITKGGKQ